MSAFLIYMSVLLTLEELLDDKLNISTEEINSWITITTKLQYQCKRKHIKQMEPISKDKY